ncbi:folate family ECF transporter S component [Limosilactobacillus sp. STM2_1]|uniref:Folate family ECF transporter S component n=1 Tax=Limosilactobacillus rudii TaxID=2759755 RepID=A0A7W3YMC7_9LACO|nr:folate family ECF transporter S component [Limosilactobacillus rudii]MBB1079245.1 folate family ECF transporter S component [Limosilactobacillus rudii]MBB1097334.1 folate family ECF transporter S component [Limosilactobacillus rudii]MCD7134443.1 folate family ECF transporter S component [Limosilactobacillus rudii]
MSTLSFTGPRFTTRNLTLAAMMVALQVILEKLSIGDPSVLKFSFGFVATALIGYCLGPWIGGWAMVVSDIISNTILSSGSLFFPGFTLSAFISGVIAGMFLYNQKISWQRVLVYEFFQILITNVIGTTLWLYLMSLSSSSSSHTFMALLFVRLPKELITWPIETIIVLIILRQLAKLNLITKN